MSLAHGIVEKAFTGRNPDYTKIQTDAIRKAELEINSLLNRSDIETTADPKNQGEILIIFIHGFSSSKYNWLDPDIGNLGWIKDYHQEPVEIDFGWHGIPPPILLAVDWSLSKRLAPKGASEIMDKNKIEWLTYSQKSPFGKIEDSVIELFEILKAIKLIYGHRRIILIAHSRGGLISKKYLDIVEKTNVEKLITFGTPFYGTFLSALDLFSLPSKYFLKQIKWIRKLWDFKKDREVENISTKQMSPNSDFLNELANMGCREDVKFVNVAGSCSHISNVYTWHWQLSSLNRNPKLALEKSKERKKLINEKRNPIEWYDLPKNPKYQVYNWKLAPKKILEIYPRIGLLEVLQGDGAVSIKSALIPLPEVKHYILHKNHMEISCCHEAYEIMIREIKECKKE
ncbi:MAG: hypothetical protein JXA54_13200 [Candidatus Heimdallarchaeota archaeon]|nr:hypothetical protein [Candidatus Heimdallarchaeota archaeon]